MDSAAYLVERVPSFSDLLQMDCRSIWENLPRLPMRQTWTEKRDVGFQPGWVSVGCSVTELVVYAELIDDWVCNPATSFNQLSFLLGDTFEIFLKNAERDDYWEIHVTPDSVLTQLHFSQNVKVLAAATASTDGRLDLTPYFVWNPAFHQRSFRTEMGWGVIAAVPLDHFGPFDSEIILEANFARYDYHRNKCEPVLSATADFSMPLSFHDQSGWHRLRLSASNLRNKRCFADAIR